MTAFVGGVVIGTSAAALLFFLGKVAGISGIAGGILRAEAGDRAWRIAFIAGLASGGTLLRALRGCRAVRPRAIGRDDNQDRTRRRRPGSFLFVGAMMWAMLLYEWRARRR
jgi:hypothetical protein